MTCHHTKKPFLWRLPDKSVRQFYADRAVGDRDRCRCLVKNSPQDHCHQKADAEDMICAPCRQICHGNHSSRIVFAIDVEEELVQREGRRCSACGVNRIRQEMRSAEQS